MITLIELQERVRLLTEENINLRKQVLDYAKKINKQKCVMKKLREYLEEEKNRLARECSQIYEDSLGKTRLVNEDIFNEVNKIIAKIEELESGKNE